MRKSDYVTWAHNHPKTVTAVSIGLQVGLAIATEGGSEMVEGAADAAEAGEAAGAGNALKLGRPRSTLDEQKRRSNIWWPPVNCQP